MTLCCLVSVLQTYVDGFVLFTYIQTVCCAVGPAGRVQNPEKARVFFTLKRSMCSGGLSVYCKRCGEMNTGRVQKQHVDELETPDGFQNAFQNQFFGPRLQCSLLSSRYMVHTYVAELFSVLAFHLQKLGMFSVS